jgi:hypothetical protein
MQMFILKIGRTTVVLKAVPEVKVAKALRERTR